MTCARCSLYARSPRLRHVCAGAASKGYAIGRRGFQESAQALSIGRPSPMLQQKVAWHRPRFREPLCCLCFFSFPEISVVCSG
jgi:hypothetical protein